MTETKIDTLGVGSRVNHPAFGTGVVIKVNKAAYQVCFTTYGIKDVGRQYEKLEVVEAIPITEGTTWSDAEKSLIKILKQWSDVTEDCRLADRWKDGTIVIKSKDPDIKSKEIPIDTFFHKIVMVRDRVRVMEQRINSSKNLDDQEKVNLQQYITRIYGSLTTFNVMFQHKEDHFVGERSK